MRKPGLFAIHVLVAFLGVYAFSCRTHEVRRYVKNHFPEKTDRKETENAPDVYIPTERVIPEIKKFDGTVKPETIVVEISSNVRKKQIRIQMGKKTLSMEEFEEVLMRETKDHRDHDDPKRSTRGILIQADKDTKFRHVQAIIKLCGKPGIGISDINICHLEESD